MVGPVESQCDFRLRVHHRDRASRAAVAHESSQFSLVTAGSKQCVAICSVPHYAVRGALVNGVVSDLNEWQYCDSAQAVIACTTSVNDVERGGLEIVFREIFVI